MTPHRWNLAQSQAEIHEQYLVPAIYAQWAIYLSHLAEIDAGHAVLDVGCGTGILARKALEEVGFSGRVCGLDLDEEMLAIASRTAPGIEWRQGDATQLPFDDASFDRVLSQFMLPHLKHRVAAVREMWRVLRPGGSLLLAVWAPLRYAPAFKLLAELTQLHAGHQAAEALGVAWALGHEIKLRTILETAGISHCLITHGKGTSKFPAPAEIVETWLRQTPDSSLVNERACRRIFDSACEELEQFRVASGELVCSMDTTVVVAKKP